MPAYAGHIRGRLPLRLVQCCQFQTTSGILHGSLDYWRWKRTLTAFVRFCASSPKSKGSVRLFPKCWLRNSSSSVLFPSHFVNYLLVKRLSKTRHLSRRKKTPDSCALIALVNSLKCKSTNSPNRQEPTSQDSQAVFAAVAVRFYAHHL